MPIWAKKANTLRGFRTGIFAGYHYPISTVFLEGLNNKIKVLKRKAYGYRDKAFFKLKILSLHQLKYQLWARTLYKETDFSTLFLIHKVIWSRPFPWGKLFERSLLTQHHIRFSEEIPRGENFIFVREFWRSLQAGRLLGTIGYHYKFHQKSLTRMLFSFYSELERYLQVRKGMNQLVNQFDLVIR